MIRNEFGGINEALYNLFSMTGDSNHLKAAEFFYHNDVIDPLKEKNQISAQAHTNTFIPKVIAEMRRYESPRGRNKLGSQQILLGHND